VRCLSQSYFIVAAVDGQKLGDDSRVEEIVLDFMPQPSPSQRAPILRPVDEWGSSGNGVEIEVTIPQVARPPQVASSASQAVKAALGPGHFHGRLSAQNCSEDLDFYLAFDEQ
jgi:hypothetical protein